MPFDAPLAPSPAVTRAARSEDVIVVPRPDGLPRLPFEAFLVTYPDGADQPGRRFWTANGRVSGAVSAIENMPLAAWVCRELNASVIAGR